MLASPVRCTRMMAVRLVKKSRSTSRGCQRHLEVPTHLHVYVVRTRYGTIAPNLGAVTFFPELEAKSVGIEPIAQKEVFTVDFKRPAWIRHPGLRRKIRFE